MFTRQSASGDLGSSETKGGLAAPLLFAGGLLAAAIASREPTLLLLAAAAGLIVTACFLQLPRGAPGVAGVAVIAFAGVVLGSVWLWGARYTPVAVYHMALLLGAFLFGRAMVQRERGTIGLGTLVLVAAAACAWGLWQFARLGYARADAWFETPNLLAAFVNLALVPIAVLTLLRGPRALGLAALVVLSAGLMVTQSRGGWLGLTGAGGVLVLLLAGTGWRPKASALAALVLSFGAAFGLVRLVPPITAWATTGGSDVVRKAQTADVSAEARLDSSESRLELYALAADGARAHPALGSGYLSFGRLFQRDQAQVPSVPPGTTTGFVHDDYLQVLLELGLLGLLPFLAITALPPLLAYRRKRTLRPGTPHDALGIAAVAGLAGMAMHALVDFPFYAPGTLAGYGLLLGIADAWLQPAKQGLPDRGARRAARGRMARIALAALSAYALAMPAAAEGCSLLASARVRRGDISDAVYWLQVASNFDPRDWRWHWQLAGLLAQQAAVLHDSKLVRFAADAYEAGMHADPGDVHNLIGWLSLQRTLGARLAHPATRAQLLARMNEATALAPLDTAVRVEHVLLLRQLGEADQARHVAQALQRDFPDDPTVRRLAGSGARG